MGMLNRRAWQPATAAAVGLLFTLSASAQDFSAQTIAADAQRRAAAIAAATPAAPWGCVVLLCLANPGGPMAIAQCVDPIRQLWSVLRSRRPFPSCPMARGPQGGAYARTGVDPYDPCPPGTTDVPPGQLVLGLRTTAVGTRAAVADALGSSSTPVAAHAPAAPPDGHISADTALPPRVCAAGRLGERWVGEGESAVTATVYQEVVLMAPAASPNYVEVMLDRGDGQGYRVWTRTRY